MEGNLATGVRLATTFPLGVNLNADPYKQAPYETLMDMRWVGELLWLLVPVGGEIQKFPSTIPDYPFQQGGYMNPSNINYNTSQAGGVRNCTCHRAANIVRDIKRTQNDRHPRSDRGRESRTDPSGNKANTSSGTATM